MISGYASIGNVGCARNVFDESPVRDVVSWNSIILACGNAGDMREARKLFEEMPERSVITWNTMLVAYLNNELPEDAVALFEKMKFSNVYNLVGVGSWGGAADVTQEEDADNGGNEYLKRISFWFWSNYWVLGIVHVHGVQDLLRLHLGWEAGFLI
ncbi:hypothetical protein RJ639_012981 [Escallonia herrerae]|uniref:Pentatricopeptide repeat-containing protein n=1 Tax=Escallonia herrerae TaxID=1293975 RepID=A0AA88VKN9_9ASTE|nr:hypothetical protein RJ639_012981 [Escallonia herrerae]